jgi:hypothetical protein
MSAVCSVLMSDEQHFLAQPPELTVPDFFLWGHLK